MQECEKHIQAVKTLLKRLRDDDQTLLMQVGPALTTVVESCLCPISRQLFEDPVTASDNHTYERSAIETWMKNSQTSPMTRDPLIQFGKTPRYLQPNMALRTTMAALKEQVSAQIQHIITECFHYIDVLKETQIIEKNRLIQALLCGILQASPKNTQAIQALHAIQNQSSMMDYQSLLTLCGGTFMRLNQNPPNEIALLSLFLPYLTLLITQETALFTLEPVEKMGLRRLLPVLEQWLYDLWNIHVISHQASVQEKHQKIITYAAELHSRIVKQTDFLIIPSGFSQLNTWWSGTSSSTVSEEHYAGASASCAIIEPHQQNPGHRQWTHIDPLSPYHQKARTLQKDKRSIALVIQQVPQENITPFFLEALITLKVIAPQKARYYRPEHGYETLLAQLEGQTHFKTTMDHLFKTSRENTFCSAWYTIKETFYYLLTPIFEPVVGKALYKKIMVDFQWTLLQRIHHIYENIPEKAPYIYLLQEMSAKMASNASTLDNIQRHYLIETLEKSQQLIKDYQQKQEEQRQAERTFKSFYQTTASFLTPDINILRDQQFLWKNVKTASHIQEASHKKIKLPWLGYGESNGSTLSAYQKLEQLHQHVEDFLKDHQLAYRFNDSLKLATIIENTLISFFSHGLNQWLQQVPPTALHYQNMATWLVKMGQLYYAAACRMAYENQRTQAPYNPLHYGKLLVIMHALYVLLDDLGRKDSLIGPILQHYKINTILNNDYSFQQLWRTLILPDQEWMRVLGELKHYLDQQKDLKPLFCHIQVNGYYDFTFAQDADQKDDNIQCALTILEHYPEQHQQFQHDFQTLSLTEQSKKWAALFFGKKSTHQEYLPALFCALREMAYYAQVSLVGISDETMQRVKSLCESSGDVPKKYTSPGVRHWTQDSGAVWSYHSIHTPSDCLKANKPSHHPAHYVLYDQAFQWMLYPHDAIKKDDLELCLENHYLAYPRKRPKKLHEGQYIQLSFIRTNPHIKFSRLYISIKENLLSLENEDHVYLIKHTLLEMTDVGFMERRFQRSRWAAIFVKLIIDLVQQVQEKVSQLSTMGHFIDILNVFYSLSAETERQAIEQCFESLRNTLKGHLSTPSVTPIQSSMLAAHIILTYQTHKNIQYAEAHDFLQKRLMIEDNVSERVYLPATLYASVMQTLLSKQEALESALNIGDNGLYAQGEFQIDVLRGRRYKDHYRVGALSQRISDHEDYQAAFGKTTCLFKAEKRTIHDKVLMSYQSLDSSEQVSRRVTLLDGSSQQLWIEEKEGKHYQTFVPHRHLKTLLPQGLIEGYTHWCLDNKIAIKNAQRNTLFLLDLVDGIVTSMDTQKQLMPFHHRPSAALPNNLTFWAIFSAFEDSHFVLLYTTLGHQIVTDIQLPRFSLTFSVRDQHIMSNNYKNYRLASCQQLETLRGFSNYLILESMHEPIQRKVIIGHRQAGHEAASFYETHFSLDCRTAPQSPHCFTYDVDETLGSLQPETLSGRFYLAWLYFKTASLSRDAFIQMNGYEMAAEMLKTCWQNEAYTEEELSILLKFLYVNHEKLHAWEKEYATSEKTVDSHQLNEWLEESLISRKEQHRNAIAILLRVLYLLSESVEMHFLFKKAQSLPLNALGQQKNAYYLKLYGTRYFLYYLNVKNRLHEKCLLSSEEERKILRACRELFIKQEREKESWERGYQFFAYEKNIWPMALENYLEILENKSVTVTTMPPEHYKKLIGQFTERNFLRGIPFESDLKRFLVEKYQSTAYSLKTVPDLTYLEQWVDFSYDFDMAHFIALYQWIRMDNSAVDKMESMLHFIAVQKRHWWEGIEMPSSTHQSKTSYKGKLYRLHNEDAKNHLSTFFRLCLQMLYMVLKQPQAFPRIPAFLFTTAQGIDVTSTFKFSDAAQTISKDEFFNTLDSTDAMKAIREALWKNFEAHAIEKNRIKFSFDDIESPQYFSFLPSDLNKERLKKVCQDKAKNKALLDFFVMVAQQCDVLKNNPAIGKNVSAIQHFKPMKTEAVIPPRFSPANPTLSMPAIPALTIPSITVDTWFTQHTQKPEKKAFPLEKAAQIYPEVFTECFGGAFMEELQASYQHYLEILETTYPLKSAEHLETLQRAIQPAIQTLTAALNAYWQQLHLELIKTPATSEGLSWRLLQHSGQRVLPTKSDIFKMLLNPELALVTFQPFLKPPLSTIVTFVRNVLQGEILLMQWKKAQAFITDYQKTNDVDEQQLLAQEIAKHLAYRYQDGDQKSALELVFELENRLVIRDNQRTVLNAMVQSVENYDIKKIGEVFQLNMGEGKTSVILILLIQILANGNRLIRVNILDALMGMMKDLLRSKFSGLIQKRIYLLPFNRDIDISLENLMKLQEALETCQKQHHFLLVTPEHRLCLHLKQQEMLVQYLAFKEANNQFDWKKYEASIKAWTRFPDEYERWYYSQEQMKKILVHLRYIDANNNILSGYELALISEKAPVRRKIELEYTDTQKLFYQTSYSGDKQEITPEQLIEAGLVSHIVQTFFSEKIAAENLLQKLQPFKEAITHIIVERGHAPLSYHHDRFYDFYDEVTEAARQLFDKAEAFRSGSFDAAKVLRTQTVSQKRKIQKQATQLMHIEHRPFCDILDEEDEILRHGTELNFTIGQPEDLSEKELRWKVPLFILENMVFNSEIKRKLENIAHGASGGLSTEKGQVRFTDKTIYNNNLKKLLFIELMKKVEESFNVKAARIISYQTYILGESTTEQQDFNHLKQNDAEISSLVILLKAWFSHDVLYHVMSKRFYIDYGLDAKLNELPKNPIVIPYKGDEDPSPRSEFEHPDVMIGLTILSYYYQGLHPETIKKTFATLKKHHKANRFLEQWSEACLEEKPPKRLTRFDTLDLEDPKTIEQVTQHFGKNPKTVAYYLSTLVFPQKAKYYRHRITGNAHTLAGSNNTVGFSGTDDRKDTLPATVKAANLNTHTNGQMIHLMTRPQNQMYRKADTSSAEHFLKEVVKLIRNEQGTKSNYYILIDSGAMTTGMNNMTVAQTLLENIHKDFQGVVYCDDTSGQKLVLQRSDTGYFSESLSTCRLDKSVLFIYLDEIHTRGSDFKLPLTARGMVTLSPGMNKDKLMQATKRLRQLENKQSVCYLGSQETTQQIMQVTQVSEQQITSTEVLLWVTYNTIQKVSSDLYPATYQSLEDLIKRRVIKYQEENLHQPLETLKQYLKIETTDNIEAHYQAKPTEKERVSSILEGKKSNLLSAFDTNLSNELQKMKDAHLFSVNKKRKKEDYFADNQKMDAIINNLRDKFPEKIFIKDNNLDTNQEKEKEVEREKEAEPEQSEDQRPQREASWEPCNIFDVQFITKGQDPNVDRKQFPRLMSLKESLQYTDYLEKEKQFEKIQWPNTILATQSFCQTIDVNGGKKQDHYLRPVDALLIDRRTSPTHFVLLSGIEANAIYTLFDDNQWKNQAVFLAHLGDTTGELAVPGPFVPSLDERYVLTILKLFNGYCDFEEEDKPLLNQILGVIEENAFVNNEITVKKSQKIHEALTKKYLQRNRFFSTNLLQSMSGNNYNTFKLDEIIDHEYVIKQKLSAIRDKSIGNHHDNTETLAKLTNFFRNMVMVRGNEPYYQDSTLQKTIE